MSSPVHSPRTTVRRACRWRNDDDDDEWRWWRLQWWWWWWCCWWWMIQIFIFDLEQPIRNDSTQKLGNLKYKKINQLSVTVSIRTPSAFNMWNGYWKPSEADKSHKKAVSFLVNETCMVPYRDNKNSHNYNRYNAANYDRAVKPRIKFRKHGVDKKVNKQYIEYNFID